MKSSSRAAHHFQPCSQPAAPPENNPSPASVPIATEPAPVGSELTGEQRLDENSLYDDFSSTALSWPIYDDGTTIVGYESQAYRFQITQPDYYDWAYFPGEFIPCEISFDVQGTAGEQDGTFGVFCQFQDEDNYYFVEFDLADNYYLIGQYLDGEFIPLTEADTSGNARQASSALSTTPTAVNHIRISCYLDFITLYINDEWETEVTISQPLQQTGDEAFLFAPLRTPMRAVTRLSLITLRLTSLCSDRIQLLLKFIHQNQPAV